MSSLNTAIASSVIRSILPCRSAAALGAALCPLPTLVSQLCAHPSYRLVTARALPQVSSGAEAFTSDSWAALQRRLVQMCESGSLLDRIAPSGASDAGYNRKASKAEDASKPAGSSASATAEPGSESARTSEPVSGRSSGTTCKSVASAAFLWGNGAVDAQLDGLRRLPLWRFALEPLQVHADTH